MKVIAYSIKINGIEKSITDLNKLAEAVKGLPKIDVTLEGSDTQNQIKSLSEAYKRVNEAQKEVNDSKPKSKGDEFKALSTQVSNYKKELEKLIQAGKGESAEAEALVSKIKSLNAVRKEASNRIKESSDSVKDSTQSKKQEQDSYSKLTAAIKEATAAYRSAVVEEGENSEAAKRLGKDLKELTDQQSNVAAATKKAISSNDESKQSYNSLGREISDYKRQLELLEIAGEGAGDEAKKLEADIVRLSLAQRDVRNRTSEAIREADAQGDAYKRLTLDLANARRQYKSLAAEEKENTDEAVKLRAEITKLDTKVKEIDASVGQFQRNVGNYSSALDGLVGRMQSLTGVDLSKFSRGITGLDGAFKKLGGGRSIFGFLGAAAIGATVELNKLVLKYDELRDRVNDVTGLEGVELNIVVGEVAAISDVFEQEFNEILAAANTVTKELTGDFNESLRLIENGFISGANASGQYLDNLREYASQARATELSANQLLEVLIRSEQEGIFSDKGIDTVKEGGLRIREQTNATRDALENAFGEDFTNDLFENLNKGAITSFEALQKVSKGLTDTELTAEQTQTVIADVFGGPGEDAGLRFIQILQDVDGEFTDLIDTTDAYTKRQIDNLEATKRLTVAQASLTEQLNNVGFSFGALGKKIQADFFVSLDGAVSKTRTYVKFFKELLSGSGLNEAGAAAFIGVAAEDIENAEKLAEQVNKTNTTITESALERNRRIIESNRILGLSERQLNEILKELSDTQKDLIPGSEEYLDVQNLIDKVNARLGKSTKESREETDLLRGSLAFLKNELSELQKAYNEAGSTAGRFELQPKIQDIENQIEHIEKLQDALFAVQSLPVEITPENVDETLDQIESIRELLEIEDNKIELGIEVNQDQYDQLTSNLDQLEERVNNFRNITVVATLESEGELAPVERTNEEVLEENIRNIELLKEQRIKASNESLLEELNKEELAAERKKEIAEETARAIKAIELNAIADTIQQRLQLEKLSSNDRAELERQLAEIRVQQATEGNEEIQSKNNDLQQAIKDNAIEIFSQTANAILELQANALETRLDNDLEALDTEYNRRIEAAEGNQALQSRLQDELEQKKTALEKEAAEERRKIAKKEAVVSAAQAVVTTLAQLGFTPASAIAIAALAAQTALQIAVIDKTKFEKGGRIVKGRRHSEGGIAAVVRDTGQQVELETDEYVVPRDPVLDSKIYRYEGTNLEILEQMSGRRTDTETRPNVPLRFERGGRVDTFSQPPAALVEIHTQRLIREERVIERMQSREDQEASREEFKAEMEEFRNQTFAQFNQMMERFTEAVKQGSSEGLTEGVINIERNRRADENSTF